LLELPCVGSDEEQAKSAIATCCCNKVRNLKIKKDQAYRSLLPQSFFVSHKAAAIGTLCLRSSVRSRGRVQHLGWKKRSMPAGGSVLYHATRRRIFHSLQSCSVGSNHQNSSLNWPISPPFEFTILLCIRQMMEGDDSFFLSHRIAEGVFGASNPFGRVHPLLIRTLHPEPSAPTFLLSLISEGEYDPRSSGHRHY
jgi:hypothetical protein